MPQKIDKELVRKRFLKSIKTYNENAYVQKLMANHLLSRLEACRDSIHFKSILELGCGTGLLTRKVMELLQPEIYYANDIVSEYQEPVRAIVEEQAGLKAFNFWKSDIEKIDYFPENIDLIISNAAIQWLTDLEKFFLKLSCSINSNTIVALTTFGPNNLHEIKTVENSSLDYYPFEELKSMMKRTFDLLYAEEETVTLNFASPFEVLKHLRNTGTTGVTKKIWTREHLRKFEESYLNHFGCENGVTLTYNPIYLIAKRK